MRVKLSHFRKFVTTAGTREQLTTAGRNVQDVTIQVESDNTGRVYVGDSLVSSSNCFASLGAGSSATISGADFGLADAMIDLTEIWLDVGTSTDGVFCGYVERKEGD